MTATEAIRSTRGRAFTARFTKKDGTTRVMNARTGVKRNLQGVGHQFDPAERDLSCVWDFGKSNYRFINLSTLESVDCGKLHWRHTS